MTGVTALEKTLIGVEALAGSSTDTVTTHWRGMGKVQDRREIVFPPEKVGKFGGTTRSYIARTGSDIPLEGDATFEQLPYIFDAGIYKATATTDNSSGFIRTWNVQASSSDPYATTDLGTLVVESGDNEGIDRARFCFVRSFALSGRQGEGMQLTATLQGREPSTDTAFTTVSDTDLQNESETILFSKVRLFIDDTSGTIGTTQVSETILEATLNMTTGWVELPAKDGRLDFSNIKRIDDEITLDVTFEHNASAEAEKANFRNEVERAIRLEFEGTALGTTDTYDAKTLIIDLWGKWRTFATEGLEEQTGDNIVRGTFRAAWSPTALNKARFIVVNEVDVLP